MRRPCADREEKRATRGSDAIRTRTESEQLDLNDPNQRGLLEVAPGLLADAAPRSLDPGLNAGAPDAAH
jgi:hypothetical protein